MQGQEAQEDQLTMSNRDHLLCLVSHSPTED